MTIKEFTKKYFQKECWHKLYDNDRHVGYKIERSPDEKWEKYINVVLESDKRIKKFKCYNEYIILMNRNQRIKITKEIEEEKVINDN